jgi:zinc D-Ala-D-Ala dipeptidase
MSRSDHVNSEQMYPPRWNRSALAGTHIIAASRLWVVAVSITLNSFAAIGAELPIGFVYLSEVAPTVRQDIRYAGSHNFTGRPVDGYEADECILTEKAADALKQVQIALAGKDLSLIVWDCYRPMRAVRDFIDWSRSQHRPLMKSEFFPQTNKNQLFARGYLSAHSAHSRGSTVDLGLVPSAVRTLPTFDATMPLLPCTAPKGARFDDGTIDLGTGFDCLDLLASTNNPNVSKEAHLNRLLLQHVMQQHGFRSYSREWWHFTLSDEPFPGRSYDFPVVARNTQARAKVPPGSRSSRSCPTERFSFVQGSPGA